MNRRRISIALSLFATLGAVQAPGAASAATYAVTACDAAPNGVTNNAWTYSETSAGRFEHGDGCASNDGSQYAGLYAREDLAQNANVPGGQSAYWQFSAPAGTTIAAIDYRRHLRTYLEEGWRSELLADNAPLEQCQVPPIGDECDRGLPGGASVSFPGLTASSLRVGVRCQPTAPSTGCGDGFSLQRVLAVIYGATVTVEDPATPTISAVGGTLTSGGWLRGIRTVSFSATDATGINRLLLQRNGTEVLADNRSCDFTRPAPCSSPGASTPASWTSVDTATWPDGSYMVTGRATDAALNEAVTAPITVQVDNTPPPAPAPATDFAWSVAANGTWTWNVPPETGVAPIDQVEVEICRDGQCETTQTTPSGPGTFTVDQPVGEGTTSLRARHRDAAGNVGAWSAPTSVRRDRALPPGLDSASDAGWRSSASLPVTWTLPTQDPGSPWTSVELELCNPAATCTIQSATAATGSTAANVSVGEGTIRSRLVDAAGNRGAWSAGRPTRTDTQPPSAPALGTPQAIADSAYRISVSFSDPGPAPVAELSGDICPTGAGACKPLTVATNATQFETAALTNGTWNVRLRAVDAAGNTSPDGQATITVGPVITPTPSPTATAVPPNSRLKPRLRIRRLKLGAGSLRLSATASVPSGAVKLVYRARVDGRSRTVTKRLRLRSGRLSVVVSIPIRARAPRAKVTLRFTGNARFRPGIATKRVRRPAS